MLDQCERLALGINLRSMQGMAGNDLDVFGQVFFKGGYLDLLTRRLTSDNGALLSRCISVSYECENGRITSRSIQGPYSLTIRRMASASTLYRITSLERETRRPSWKIRTLLYTGFSCVETLGVAREYSHCWQTHVSADHTFRICRRRLLCADKWISLGQGFWRRNSKSNGRLCQL